jgi:hypothetical protein
MNLATAIERLYSLNVGIIGIGSGCRELPHKPLLLLAAFDLIDSGLATPERIPWCQELRDRFTDRFLLVRKHDDQNTPDNPFHYLQSEGFWQAWTRNSSYPATSSPCHQWRNSAAASQPAASASKASCRRPQPANAPHATQNPETAPRFFPFKNPKSKIVIRKLTQTFAS